MVDFFRKIARNWKLKTLAFSLAVLLWVAVSSEQITTNWLTVPLQVQVTDSDYRVDTADLPDEVQVRLSGPTRDLLDLAFRRPPFVLTVGGVMNPIETRTLEPRMLQIPGQMGVTPIDVRPSTLRLQFTRIDAKMVPVRVRVTNRLGAEWAVVDTITAEPEQVEVSGPAHLLAPVTEVLTQPFELTSSDSVIDRAVALDTAVLGGLDLSTNSVRLSGRIDRVIERTITDVPVDVGPGVSIIPAEVDVTMRGAESAVRSVNAANFRIVISIGEIPTRIPPGGVVVPLRIDRLRPGVTALLSPGQVRLFPQPLRTDTIAPEALIGDAIEPNPAPEPE